MLIPFEQELDTIRIHLYEATKNMTAQERMAYLRKLSASAHEQHDIEIVAAPKVRVQPTQRRNVA
ncbi:MAG: hypothetical protein FWD06_02610 [Oscillospiraceae bacterium]|nr:hypothetical protein [Oscillospiraceae bacterium]